MVFRVSGDDRIQDQVRDHRCEIFIDNSFSSTSRIDVNHNLSTVNIHSICSFFHEVIESRSRRLEVNGSKHSNRCVCIDRIRFHARAIITDKTVHDGESALASRF